MCEQAKGAGISKRRRNAMRNVLISFMAIFILMTRMRRDGMQ